MECIHGDFCIFPTKGYTQIEFYRDLKKFLLLFVRLKKYQMIRNVTQSGIYIYNIVFQLLFEGVTELWSVLD